MTSVNIVGSGPNGLAAAVTLARAGLEVTVFEAQDTPGGGCRTLDVTGTGSRHDLCSAVHPMALTSPFFRAFELQRRVDYLVPDLSYAHAVAPGHSALAWRDLDRTAAGLGDDGRAWHRLFAPLAAHIDRLGELILDSMLRGYRDIPMLARLSTRVLAQGGPWGDLALRGDARALFAGVAAHAITPLPSLGGAAAGLTLGAHAHAGGWPVPHGGADAVTKALLDDLAAHGGAVRTGAPVRSRSDLSPGLTLVTTSTRNLLAVGGDRLLALYHDRIARLKPGNAAAKVDILIRGDIPWADPALAATPTVHLGGSAHETRDAERAVARGIHPAVPYVLLCQPGVIDPSRAAPGHSTVWAYTHVPQGSPRDMTEAVLTRIEQFAPGFRERIVAVQGGSARDVEAHNAAYVGGDISGGRNTAYRLIARPVLSPQPWRTPLPDLYVGGAGTVPGPGVHGMGGFLAARTMLADLGASVPSLAVGD